MAIATVPTISRSHRPVIILDWDDTLLPTFALTNLGVAVDESSHAVSLFEEDQAALNLLSAQVKMLLEKCIETAECYIITNSEDGWVHRSCELFLPDVLPLLKSIPVISACSKYASQYPWRPLQWKIAAFRDVLEEKDANEPMLDIIYPVSDPKCHGSKSFRQITAFGDADSDREAIHTVGRCLKHFTVKSIQFVQDPDLYQLHKQLSWMNKFMDELQMHTEPLDLVITKKML